MPILRGLKPRYETHHGVQIKDSAIVAAAELPSAISPIAFCPTRPLTWSMKPSAPGDGTGQRPEEIDEVQRRSTNWNLPHDNWPTRPRRRLRSHLADIEDEIQEQKQKEASLREQWEAERLGMGDIQHIRDRSPHRRRDGVVNIWTLRIKSKTIFQVSPPRGRVPATV